MNSDTLAHLPAPGLFILQLLKAQRGWGCRLVVCPEFLQTYLHVQVLESDIKIDRQGDLFSLISYITYAELVMI